MANLSMIKSNQLMAMMYAMVVERSVLATWTRCLLVWRYKHTKIECDRTKGRPGEPAPSVLANGQLYSAMKYCRNFPRGGLVGLPSIFEDSHFFQLGGHICRPMFGSITVNPSILYSVEHNLDGGYN